MNVTYKEFEWLFKYCFAAEWQRSDCEDLMEELLPRDRDIKDYSDEYIFTLLDGVFDETTVLRAIGALFETAE